MWGRGGLCGVGPARLGLCGNGLGWEGLGDDVWGLTGGGGGAILDQARLWRWEGMCGTGLGWE